MFFIISREKLRNTCRFFFVSQMCPSFGYITKQCLGNSDRNGKKELINPINLEQRTRIKYKMPSADYGFALYFVYQQGYGSEIY